MTDIPPDAPERVASLSPVALASVLDQSVDCVKLIGLDGNLQWMNGNGMCAMEIDDFAAVDGRAWVDFWPDDVRPKILAAYPTAASGQTVRFRASCPTYRGAPRWWDVTVSAVTNADGLHAGYLAISRDATENQQSREALDIAAKELRHRLKNTYTMISSLMMGFARGNDHHVEFANQMTDRLVALSRAQALFANNDAPCQIDALVDALVVPFSNAYCAVDVEALPDFQVDQGRADAIALVIGELAVNSSKHGAIHHGGAVKVCGQIGADRFSIVWDETSNGPVEHRSRDGGQGLELMRRIVKARGGTLSVDWRDDGLDVTITFSR